MCISACSVFCRCLFFDWSTRAGIRAEVAVVENVGSEAAQNVEAPVVVVTGASRGIGKAIALALGKSGCKVDFFLLTVWYKFAVYILWLLQKEFSNILVSSKQVMTSYFHITSAKIKRVLVSV